MKKPLTYGAIIEVILLIISVGLIVTFPRAVGEISASLLHYPSSLIVRGPGAFLVHEVNDASSIVLDVIVVLLQFLLFSGLSFLILKSKNLLVRSHVLAFPLCVTLLAVVVDFSVNALLNLRPDSYILHTCSHVLLPAYYLVPNFGIAYLFLLSIVLFRDWRRTNRRPGNVMYLSLYSAVLLLYLCYIAWWYLTRQTFAYP
jgi:hypothetical protein